MLLDLDKIGYDPEYYPRVNGKEDWLTVHRYKEALLSHPDKAKPGSPGAFPEVVVVKAVGYDWPYILLDGLHRARSFSAAGYDQIGAIIERLPQSKWLERSVELNIDSKRALDSGDKRWVASRLTADGWKPEKIAALLCMETGSFEKLMATSVQKLTKASSESIPMGRSNRRIGKEHVGFLKPPFSGLSGTANAQKALRAQSAVSSRDTLQIVESFIALLESRAVDLTDEHLHERLTVAGALLDERLAVT